METEPSSNSVKDMDRQAGRLVAAMRRSRGVSQTAAAAVLQVDQPAISRIERGERRLTVGEFLALTRVLGVPIEEIAGRLEAIRSAPLSKLGSREDTQP